MAKNIEKQISLIEEILSKWEDELGDEYMGYRNHVYRMVHFCLAQGDFTGDLRRKIIIAGCFHDIGIWSCDTFDYIPPSVAEAKQYLTLYDLEPWESEITLMIEMHHKLRKYPDRQSLVEIFRKGDLVDFSLGLVNCGLPRRYIRTIQTNFPNAGFHRGLVRLAGRWICKHPLNPVPVLRW